MNCPPSNTPIIKVIIISKSINQLVNKIIIGFPRQSKHSTQKEVQINQQHTLLHFGLSSYYNSLHSSFPLQSLIIHSFNHSHSLLTVRGIMNDDRERRVEENRKTGREGERT